MHATEYTDMSINVSRVLLKLTGNWVTMNDTEKRHRVLAMSYTIVALVYGVYVNVVDVYHSLDDLDLLAVQQIGISYICNENFFCLLNLHMVYQFRMLQYKLRKFWLKINEQTDIIAYTSRCHTELKKCIEQHQSLIRFSDRIETIYTLPILGHVVVFSMLMCFDSYEIILADTPPSKKVSLVLNLGGTFFQFLMFTYSCDNLIRQSVDVGNAVFSGPWANLPMDKVGTVVRKNLIIVIMRSHRVCSLTAGGFFPISLETYTAVLSTAMSYFTLLKRSSDVEDT
ncbi:Odorant receptor Or2 [Eufriesea mexicana]|uniref:Odorant receptor Or2 n=1 Tax=Eufriesea mexicana TaxID=516756 RepID=A0A310SKQ6_9HYME|nr:Odorant receptor Or2 [Eufriesea mexicana]